MNLTIRNIEIKDIPIIAKSYKNTLNKEHFSVNFPVKLLQEYLATLVNHFEFNRILVNENGVITGYLVGGKFPSDAVKRFIKKNLFRIISVFVRNPKFAIEKFYEIAQNIISPEKDSNLDENTICLIATDKKEQGKGYGQLLIKDFESLLKANHYHSYYLAVRKSNMQAINFYEKGSFTKIKETKHMKYYQKKI